MNKLFVYIIITLFFTLQVAYSSTIHYYNKSNNNVEISSSKASDDNEYCTDLGMVEKYLFGRIYVSDSTSSRMTRIERRLFGRNYSSLKTSERMNNILSNYALDSKYSGLNSYYNNMSIRDRVINSILGQPTGYTPPIYPSPYLNDRIAPSYMQGYYGNNNLKYHNMVRPVSTGTGVHILQ